MHGIGDSFGRQIPTTCKDKAKTANVAIRRCRILLCYIYNRECICAEPARIVFIAPLTLALIVVHAEHYSGHDAVLHSVRGYRV